MKNVKEASKALMPESSVADTDYSYDLSKKDVELQIKLEELKDRRQDRELRKELGSKIIRLVYAYMGAVLLLLLLTGFGLLCFSLSDGVLMTILGTTTADIIAILVIQAKYYYNRK